jgi:FlaA1/EpsC-like NDP-sugar epimerase
MNKTPHQNFQVQNSVQSSWGPMHTKMNASPLGTAALSGGQPHEPSKIRSQLRRWGFRLIVALGELSLVALSFGWNWMLLFRHGRSPWEAEAFRLLLLYAIVIRACGLICFDAFRRSFRHASVPDLIAIAKSVGASGVAIYFVYYLYKPPVALPATFFLSDAVTVFLLLSAFQFSARLYNIRRASARTDLKRTLIVGAGDSGAFLVKELFANQAAGMRPVAVLDDDPRKKGTSICGVPVLGDLSLISKTLLDYRAVEILICIPSATRDQMNRVLTACLQHGVPVRTLAAISDMANGRVSTRDLRPIRIEDILQRDLVDCDPALTESLVSDKVVLVTGAGGSIGSELCRQLVSAHPRTLILLDKSENSLFYSHLSVRERGPEIEAIPCLADITDMELLRDIFLRHSPDIVFHAAAFKHVGMMELHPHEAIRNNILGTRNVAMAALASGVKCFVNISTDKAVNPRNYMGLSKKFAELIIQDLAAKHRVRFMNVRFGNVAGSTGSVLRLFAEQIQKGGPLRVSDPLATRYFMTIPEAVYLIFCAAALGRGGETFILDMGEPINIYQLARALSLYSGFIPDEELPIEFTGLCDGEKIHEELWEEWECPESTSHSFLLAVTGNQPSRIDVAGALEAFEMFLACRDYRGLVECLHGLFPGFARDGMPHHEVPFHTSNQATAKVQ